MILTPGRGGVVFRRSADGAFPVSRLVQSGDHLRVAAADTGIGDFGL